MSWLECLYFYLRSGQPEYSLIWISTLWRSGIVGDLSAYLVIYISVLLFCCQLCISGLLCIWDFMLYRFSDWYYVFGFETCDSSFMNYYGILFSAARYSDVLCPWFCDLIFICSEFLLQSVILYYSSPACVDYRFEWWKITGRYSWYQSFGF